MVPRWLGLRSMQTRQKFFDGAGVEEVGGAEPGAAELHDAVVDLIELVGGMGVGVDDDLAAVFFGEAEVEVVEVGARGRGVVFDGDAEARGSGEELGEVDLVRLALQDLAAGGVAEDVDVRIFGGAEDAGGDFFGGLVEAGVDAGDDDVELGEGLVGEVERAVEEDVDLDAGEDAEGDCGLEGVGLVVVEAGLVALPLGAAAGGEFFGELGRRPRGCARRGRGRGCRPCRWSWRGSWSGR